MRDALLVELRARLADRRRSLEGIEAPETTPTARSSKWDAFSPIPPDYVVQIARKAHLLASIREFARPQTQELLRSIIEAPAAPQSASVAPEIAPPEPAPVPQGWSFWKLMGY